MLGREVRHEINETQRSPWLVLDSLFSSADFVGGNLEGAIGPGTDCLRVDGAPCFAAPLSAASELAAAHFRAVTIENNHTGDLGGAGREHTRDALRKQGILALDFARSPQFVRVGKSMVALIAVTTIRAADSAVQTIPSVTLEQKLRLARRLADFVVVSVHWGSELVDWTTPEQRQQAIWLSDHGADLVVGHHPHVVQAAECIHGKPVFFSLGNHVFDQKYPATKIGEIADCRIGNGMLRCAGIMTQTGMRTSVPAATGLTDAALANCAVAQGAPLVVGGFTIRPEPWSPTSSDSAGIVLSGWLDGHRRWSIRRGSILSLETGLSMDDGSPLLFSLERHFSPIDSEIGVRPYVYAVTANGPVARWRGSSLAWPLLDAIVATDGSLCALHRGDSFLVLDPASTATRVMRYRWNGFGFDADAAGPGDCAARLED